jgi:hypothetical protein
MRFGVLYADQLEREVLLTMTKTQSSLDKAIEMSGISKLTTKQGTRRGSCRHIAY